jgi:hypothetical protein
MSKEKDSKKTDTSFLHCIEVNFMLERASKTFEELEKSVQTRVGEKISEAMNVE